MTKKELLKELKKYKYRVKKLEKVLKENKPTFYPNKNGKESVVKWEEY